MEDTLDSRYTDVLRARCTPELKLRLQRVAQRNPVSRDLADHIRLAVEEYISRNESPAGRPQEFMD